MLSFLWAILGIATLVILWVVFGAFNAQGRLRAKDQEIEKIEQELEEWSGVLDVKREIRDKLNNPVERKRLFDKYNKNDKGK